MSKEVKRYVPEYCESGGEIWAEMQEDSEGGWVRAADYDALLAERDALKKDAERYRLYRQGFEKPEVFDANVDAAMQGEQPCT